MFDMTTFIFHLNSELSCSFFETCLGIVLQADVKEEWLPQKSPRMAS